jgi:hypothetical protein
MKFPEMFCIALDDPMLDFHLAALYEVETICLYRAGYIHAARSIEKLKSHKNQHIYNETFCHFKSH